MSVRHSRPILFAATAVLLTACDPDADPTAPAIPDGAAAYLHQSSSACVVHGSTLAVTADPGSVAIGGRATLTATVTRRGSGAVSTGEVVWTTSDTAVFRISGPDMHGRYYALGVGAGKANAIARCGALVASTPVSVTGGETTPTDSAQSPAKIVVALDSAELQPGETTQARVQELNASGEPTSIGTVAWTSSNAGIATVGGTGLVTALAAGSVDIVATVGTTVGKATITVTTTATTPTTPPTEPTPPSGLTAARPELPRATVTDAGYVAPTGRIIRVPAGGGVQEALDSARPGDAVVLAAGASYYGNFVLPANGSSGSCSSWTILTSDGSLPAAGTRATPQLAASGFGRLLTTNVDAALKTAPGANCWRVVGVELAVAPSFSGLHYGLVLLGNGDDTSVDQEGRGFVLDRLYIHGQSSTNLIRCVALNSGRAAIINSWISDCHARGFDSQAIAGWNGPGPYLIENNRLEAAGENVMFGGADPKIANLVPSDITIRRNYFYKRLEWNGVWTVKNLFELKSARRLLVEGNIFENNWADAQTGMAIVIKSANDGGSGSWQGTTDVTFRSNIVRNSPQGLNIAAHPESNPVVPVARVAVENNLFENIGTFGGSTNGRMLILMQDLHDVSITSNTMIHNTTASGMTAIMDYSGGAARNIVIRDNVATKGGPYGALLYSGIRIGTTSLDAFAAGSWAFDRNVIIGIDPEFVPWHPQSSWYPYTMAAVGFVNAGGGDYRLSSSSPYKGKATNGSDPGANFDTLQQLTSGVR